MLEYGFKTGPPDLAATKDFVPVEMLAERSFAVIEVEADYLLPREVSSEVSEVGIDVGRFSQVVSGREEVAGIETDGETVGLFRILDEEGEVCGFCPQNAALAGGGFEGDSGLALVAVQDPVDRLDDSLQTFLLPGTEMGPWVEHDEWKFEKRAAVELVEERMPRLLQVSSVDRGEIDEVSGVGKHAVYGSLFFGLKVEGKGGRVDRFGRPLHVVLGEDLDDFAAQFLTQLKGLVVAPRDGAVGPYLMRVLPYHFMESEFRVLLRLPG